MIGERAALAALDGSCRTPIGAYAAPGPEGIWSIRVLVALPDGSEVFTAERQGAASDLEAMGRDAGQELKSRVPDWVFDDDHDGA